MGVLKFKVTYIDPEGREVESIIVGKSRDELVNELVAIGCTPINIRRHRSLSFTSNARVLRAFFRNLVDLLKSGYSVNTALEILYENEKNSSFKSTLRDISESINKGYTITDSLALHPEWFNISIRTMVETGEKASRLIPVLEECVKYIDKETELNESIVKQLTTPIFTLLFGLLILFFNVFVTIPKITKTDFYRTMMAKNAGIGIMLIKATSVAVPLLLITIVIASFSFFYFYKVKQEKAEKLLFKVPIIRTVWFNREMFLLYFSLSKLIQVGVNLETALYIIGENARLKQIKNGIRKSLEAIREGKDISETLPLLDNVDRSLIKSATTSKQLGEIFYNVSMRKYDEYQEAVKMLPGVTRTITYLILMYLFLIIFFGVIVPYYKSINSAMSNL